MKKRAIPCPHCKGQCYFQRDEQGGIELKCLQCSRTRPEKLTLIKAEAMGMKRRDYYRFIVDDWSMFAWDDGEPVIDWSES